MIRLYIVRHGIAVEPADFDLGDEARPLTPKGRRRFRRAARAFSRIGERIDSIFTSPLVRAVQTAEILGARVGHDAIDVLAELKPDVQVAHLLAALAKRLEDGEGAALVGHDPQVTQLLLHLSGASQAEAARLDFRKGAIVRVDVPELPKARPAKVLWHMKPRTRAIVEGLPLRKAAPSR